jgi:hypothetical protein
MSKENEISMLKRYLWSHFHCSGIHNSQDVEKLNSSTDEWINKMWYICVCINT